jgi:hypothetical protein
MDDLSTFSDTCARLQIHDETQEGELTVQLAELLMDGRGLVVPELIEPNMPTDDEFVLAKFAARMLVRDGWRKD